MGEIDGAFRAWGFAKNGTGGVTRGDRAVRRARSASRSAPMRPCSRSSSGRPRGGRRARERRRVAGEGRACPPPTRSAASCSSSRRSTSPTSSSQQIQELPRARFVGQGQHRAERAARLHLPARRRPAAPRRDLDQPEHRIHRARLRRGQVRPVREEPVHRHDHPLDDRPRHGAARPPRDVVLRAVRARTTSKAAGTTPSARRSARR